MFVQHLSPIINPILPHPKKSQIMFFSGLKAILSKKRVKSVKKRHFDQKSFYLSSAQKQSFSPTLQAVRAKKRHVKHGSFSQFYTPIFFSYRTGLGPWKPSFLTPKCRIFWKRPPIPHSTHPENDPKNGPLDRKKTQVDDPVFSCPDIKKASRFLPIMRQKTWCRDDRNHGTDEPGQKWNGERNGNFGFKFREQFRG